MPVAYKRLPKDHHKGKAEIAARKKRMNAARQKKFRQKYLGNKAARAERAERKAIEEARLFHWDRILPHIDKHENGCWMWTGPFRVLEGRVRPVVYAGVFGCQPADFVVICLEKGRPPPRCFVRSICETLGCVAPAHLVWSNHAVESAKRRLQYVEKGMVERLVGRRGEGQPEQCGDAGPEPAERGQSGRG